MKLRTTILAATLITSAFAAPAHAHAGIACSAMDKQYAPEHCQPSAEDDSTWRGGKAEHDKFYSEGFGWSGANPPPAEQPTHYSEAEMQAMAHHANMMKCDKLPTWFGALACRFDSY